MRTSLLMLTAVVLVGAAGLSGQAQRGPATLDDVVNEIRGLRADLKKSTAATTQAQLLTVRLQLQEQRLAVLSNQRNDVTVRLSAASRLRTDIEGQIRGFEDMAGRNESVGIPRAELNAMLEERKRAYAAQRDAEQQLRAQESQLSTEIVNEQNRWQDFNNRLDELERSLK